LPTSVEWEKVAKGGFLDKKFPSGKNTLDISDANYLESGLSGSKRVGSYPANPYGLYDLTGNVYEWVWDFFDGINPSETVDPRGPVTGTTRTWRGGYWGSNKDDCAVNFKNYNHPFERHTAGGFRTAITLSELPRQSVEIIKQPSEVVSQQGESCEFFVVAKNAAYYL
jgi:formylglycine-generating enzyme required for sulfatase activity